MAVRSMGPHGFVWPAGMPQCAMCERDPNDPVHVTPPRVPQRYGERRIVSALDKNPDPKWPVRSHAYTPSVPMVADAVTCQACGQQLAGGQHPPGMPAGMFPHSSDSGIGMSVGTGGSPFGAGPALASVAVHGFEPTAGSGQNLCVVCGGAFNDPIHSARQSADLSDGSSYDQAQRALTLMAIADEALDQAQPLLAAALGMPNPDSDDNESAEPQVAFVSELGERLIIATHGHAVTDAGGLPREVAATFQRASAANPYNLWVSGRYVEADRPNRNAAFWSTADLEIGQPSVTHGPVNWNHQEKQIIGAIAASEMVMVDRQAAMATGVGNHIVALAAIWSYIWPEQARAVQRASADNRLWYSMECVSKTVACLTPSCGKDMAYGDYMRQQASRCDHMKAGLPRRFVEPTFGGGAMIVPPVRPGWANADARVLMKQAAAVAERQAAALAGLTTSEAELLVAQLIQSGAHDA